MSQCFNAVNTECTVILSYFLLLQLSFGTFPLWFMFIRCCTVVEYHNGAQLVLPLLSVSSTRTSGFRGEIEVRPRVDLGLLR